MTKNQIIELAAAVIVDKYNKRIILEKEDGVKFILVDFTSAGEEFDKPETVAIFSEQEQILRDDTPYPDVEEIDYGEFTEYTEVFDYIEKAHKEFGYTTIRKEYF